jgi:nucleoside-diphosphate-sugar epimerase
MNPDVGPTNALVTGISALVSGATGFLGAHLLAKLREKGFRVRALARQTSDIAGLVRQGVDICEGDVADPQSLRRAMAGQQLVFHTAGKVSDWGTRQEFWQANVQGTANVISACRQAGVKRLIHVSSLTVFGLPRSGARVDEKTPLADSIQDFYTISKIAGERLVREVHGSGGLETVVIRPGVIWGPGDTTILPRLAELLRRGQLVFIGRGANRLGLSHVENLSQGIILAALTPAAAGQVYHLTDGEEITARAAFCALAAALGVPPPRFTLPFAVVHFLAAFLEWTARLRHDAAPPVLTRYGVRLVACDSLYDISKAQNELGYRPLLTFRQGIATLVPPAGEP